MSKKVIWLYVAFALLFIVVSGLSLAVMLGHDEWIAEHNKRMEARK